MKFPSSKILATIKTNPCDFAALSILFKKMTPKELRTGLQSLLDANLIYQKTDGFYQLVQKNVDLPACETLLSALNGTPKTVKDLQTAFPTFTQTALKTVLNEAIQSGFVVLEGKYYKAVQDHCSAFPSLFRDTPAQYFRSYFNDYTHVYESKDGIKAVALCGCDDIGTEYKDPQSKAEIKAILDIKNIVNVCQKCIDLFRKIDTQDVPKIDTQDVPKIDTSESVPKIDTQADVSNIDTQADVPKIDTQDVPKIDTSESVPKMDTQADVPNIDTQDVPNIDTSESVPKIDTQDVPKMDTQDVPKMDTQDVPKIDTSESVPIIDTQADVPNIDTQDVPNIDTQADVIQTAFACVLHPFTASEIANKTGVIRNHASGYKSAKRAVSLEKALSIASKLGIGDAFIGAMSKVMHNHLKNL